MDILQHAAEMFKQKAGGSDGFDPAQISEALGGVLSNADGKLDLQGVISKLNSQGLMSMVSSWLGDGDNEGISADQIRNLVGNEKISEFASKLGVEENAAVEGLTGAIPQMIDKASSGGSLLDSLGGLGDLKENAGSLLGTAKKMFGN